MLELGVSNVTNFNFNWVINLEEYQQNSIWVVWVLLTSIYLFGFIVLGIWMKYYC